jgi:hypothetical protein
MSEEEQEEEEEEAVWIQPVDPWLRFSEWEYKALRKEIDRAESELFKLMTGGAAIVPLAQGLSASLERGLGFITLVLPLIIIVIVTQFIERNNSIMRCGQYIKDILEEKFKEYGVIGWEHWLEQGTRGSRRQPEKYIIRAFLFLFFVYYIVSIFLIIDFVATASVVQEFFTTISMRNDIAVGVVAAFYILLGLWAANLIRLNTRSGTS